MLICGCSLKICSSGKENFNGNMSPFWNPFLDLFPEWEVVKTLENELNKTRRIWSSSSLHVTRYSAISPQARDSPHQMIKVKCEVILFNVGGQTSKHCRTFLYGPKVCKVTDRREWCLTLYAKGNITPSKTDGDSVVVYFPQLWASQILQWALRHILVSNISEPCTILVWTVAIFFS